LSWWRLNLPRERVYLAILEKGAAQEDKSTCQRGNEGNNQWTECSGTNDELRYHAHKKKSMSYSCLYPMLQTSCITELLMKLIGEKKLNLRVNWSPCSHKK